MTSPSIAEAVRRAVPPGVEVRRMTDAEWEAFVATRDAERPEDVERRRRIALRRAHVEHVGEPEFGDADRRALARATSGAGLYVFGKVGVGKTRWAKGIVRAAVEAGQEALFETFADLMDMALSRDDADPDAPRRYRERVRSVRVLAIDDVGHGNPTNARLDELRSLLGDRLDAGLPTVVTSNYALPDLGAALASGGNGNAARAVVDRLSALEQRELTGRSHRQDWRRVS